MSSRSLFVFLCLMLLSLSACAGGEAEMEPALPEATQELEAAAEEPVEEPAEEPAGEQQAGEGAVVAPTPEQARPTRAPQLDVAPEPTPNFGRMSYDVPDEMQLGETQQVILLMDSTGSEDLEALLESELAEAGQAPSDIQSATIEVARRMSARLISVPPDAFRIDDVHLQLDQELRDDRVARWEWAVTPQKGGQHRLDLVVYRFVERDGIVDQEWDEVYRDDVTVNVSFQRRLADAWAGFDYKWVIGTLIVPFVFYYLSRRDAGKEKNG